MRLGWYRRRLRAMRPGEMLHRARALGRQAMWFVPGLRPRLLRTLLTQRPPAPALARRAGPMDGAATAVAGAADALLAGEWPIFHLRNTRLGDVPDWFRDPLTGTVAPSSPYCFLVPHRNESRVGRIKFVWELSRHQATTLLACAWWLTGREEYAERVRLHLTGWWRDNPFLTGIHWVSGIEVGLRLLSWCWIRALLADWPGVTALFDGNDTFLAQLYGHQRYLRAFRSHGSSANNHRIAESAGLATAATAFPWFRESQRWAREAGADLAQQAELQTHADGLNREQAMGYHLFVAEILVATGLQGRLAGRPFPPALDATVQRMADALAATLDTAGQPPRFGDADDGRGLLVDAPGQAPARALLDAARGLYGATPWWPGQSGSVLGRITTAIAGPEPGLRDLPRPAVFTGAGLAILRAGTAGREIWIRCDGGPHGYLSTAAHGHADALSVELRYGGTDILTDPGTYCYQGEPEWRALFRGTAGHNSLCVDGLDQAEAAGPFLWETHPDCLVAAWPQEADQRWEASHDGYARLPDPVRHHRRVHLAPQDRTVTIGDWITAKHDHTVMMPFHLGPALEVSIQDGCAHLHWPGGAGMAELPPALHWTVRRGEVSPPFGWYSQGFGHLTPASVLVGRGTLSPGTVLESRFTFPP